MSRRIRIRVGKGPARQGTTSARLFLVVMVSAAMLLVPAAQNRAFAFPVTGECPALQSMGCMLGLGDLVESTINDFTEPEPSPQPDPSPEPEPDPKPEKPKKNA